MLLRFEELQTEVREDGGFEELNEFINLNEKVDSDFEFSAGGMGLALGGLALVGCVHISRKINLQDLQ